MRVTGASPIICVTPRYTPICIAFIRHRLIFPLFSAANGAPVILGVIRFGKRHEAQEIFSSRILHSADRRPAVRGKSRNPADCAPNTRACCTRPRSTGPPQHRPLLLSAPTTPADDNELMGNKAEMVGYGAESYRIVNEKNRDRLGAPQRHDRHCETCSVAGGGGPGADWHRGCLRRQMARWGV